MHRLLLVAVMTFLTVILLLNPSVQQGCLAKSIRLLEMSGGVLPFNETYLYETLTNDFLKLYSQNLILLVDNNNNFTTLPVMKAGCPAGVRLEDKVIKFLVASPCL
jgi:hypothetical protein